MLEKKYTIINSIKIIIKYNKLVCTYFIIIKFGNNSA